MKSNIINDIWKIRGKISLAIEQHDIETFNKARDRFCEIYRMKKHLNTIATMTAGRVYETQDELDYDNETNFAMLAYDLNRKRKDVLDIQDNIPLNIQFSSPIELLWYTREMFDELVLNSKHNFLTVDQCEDTYNAIINNLNEILECFVGFNDLNSLDEKTTLLVIKQEVEDMYKKFYGNKIEQEEKNEY